MGTWVLPWAKAAASRATAREISSMGGETNWMELLMSDPFKVSLAISKPLSFGGMGKMHQLAQSQVTANRATEGNAFGRGSTQKSKHLHTSERPQQLTLSRVSNPPTGAAVTRKKMCIHLILFLYKSINLQAWFHWVRGM